MMKKYLLTSAAAIGLIAGSSQATDTITFVGLTGGWAHTSAKTEIRPGHTHGKHQLPNGKDETYSRTVKESNTTNGFQGEIYLGRQHQIADNWFLGRYGFINYTSGAMKVADITNSQAVTNGGAGRATDYFTGTGKVDYLPSYQVGLGVYFLRALNEHWGALFGLRGAVSFSSFKTTHTSTFTHGNPAVTDPSRTYNTKYNTVSLFVGPQLGLTYTVNESWVALVDARYMFQFYNTESGMNQMGTQWKRRPHQFSLNVGLAYTF